MTERRKAKWALPRLLLLSLLVLANSRLALGQVSASITGRVEDASGAAIPGATVTVTSQETGETRTVTSDDAGGYRALSLAVGRYQVKAEKAGFKAEVQTGINLVVDQQAVVNLRLEVGQVQQEVTVTSEAPLINTTTASIAGLVGEQQVKELPLNGRSFDMLITLDAGATNFTSLKGTTGNGSASGNLFSVSGRYYFENLFLMNGVEYMGPTTIHSVPGGVSGQLLGIDAVREFNVVSDAYGAEYGKRAGAQVSIVTQSGTNQLHGSVFEFIRNSVLDARDFFDHPLTGRIPPFKRNQFGGALGGPIRKDKTFVFGNYEGFRQRLGVSDVTFVPDNFARQGIMDDGVTPYPGVNSAMLAYMAYWPVANGPNLGNGIATAYSNPLQSIREDFGTVRVDHSFSDKDQLAAVYTVDDGYNLTPQQDPFFAQLTTSRSQVVSLGETHLFSSNLINIATVGFSRASLFYKTPPLISLPSSLSFVQGNVPGRISIGGGTVATNSSITIAGSSLTPFYIPRRNQFTYEDSLQIIKGKHQISLGVSIVPLQTNNYGSGRQSGSASFTNLQSFLQGTVATFQVTPSAIPHYWRQLEGAWYVEDNIQLRPNLTVRIGLRHEFTNGWNEAKDNASDFLFNSAGILQTQPVQSSSIFTQNNSKWLFGPRAGIAWDPFGKGKTSIRVGGGIYYDLLDSLSFNVEGNPPYNGVATFSNVPLLSIVPVNPTTPVPPSCGVGVPTPCTTYAPGGVEPAAQVPTVEAWNLSIEQQLASNTSLTISYVGSHGYHGLLRADDNSIVPEICDNAGGCTAGGVSTTRTPVTQGTLYVPVAARPNPFLGPAAIWGAESNSSYNALRVELTQRFSAGLQFKANYTWSKSLDESSNLGNQDSENTASNIMEPYNIAADWGPAATNQTHRFVLSGVYELPLGQGKPWLNNLSGAGLKMASGWQVNWIVTVQSGFPFTPLAGSNRSQNGDTSNPDRPSWNPTFSGPVITGDPNQWFNPSAFILPPVGTFGNVSRDVLLGPNLREVDLSLFKTTKVTERVNLQLRVETFNLFNRANFSYPSINVFSGSTVNPSAGSITNTATDPRRIQFGAKFIF